MIDQHSLDNMQVEAQVYAQTLWMKFQIGLMAERATYAEVMSGNQKRQTNGAVQIQQAPGSGVYGQAG